MYRTLLRSLASRKQCGWEIFLGEMNISRCCVGLRGAKSWAVRPNFQRNCYPTYWKIQSQYELADHLYGVCAGFLQRKGQKRHFPACRTRSGWNANFQAGEGEPLQTSYGQDSYKKMFAVEDHTVAFGPDEQLNRNRIHTRAALSWVDSRSAVTSCSNPSKRFNSA